MHSVFVERSYKPDKGYSSRMGSKGQEGGSGQAGGAVHSQISWKDVLEHQDCAATTQLTHAERDDLTPHLL